MRIKIGTEFAERMSKVSKALESGANCDAITIAFTHPHFLDKLVLGSTVYFATAYSAALELASLSGESVDREYFGQLVDSPIERLKKEDFENGVKNARAVWFVSADIRDPRIQEDVGYNHMLGIIPSQEEKAYIAMDASGYINPLTSLSLDELYEEIQGLPVGEDYVQAIISFKDRELAGREPEPIQEYQYFRPTNEAGRRFRHFPFFR